MAGHNKKHDSKRFPNYKDDNYSSTSQELKNWSYSDSMNRDKYNRPNDPFVTSSTSYEKYNNKPYLDNLSNTYQKYSADASNNQNSWNSQHSSNQYSSYTRNVQSTSNGFNESSQMNYNSQNNSAPGNLTN
jgi:hypothetical protein